MFFLDVSPSIELKNVIVEPHCQFNLILKKAQKYLSNALECLLPQNQQLFS